MSTNREQFNATSRRILSDLVEACPLTVAITAETYGLPKGENVSDGEGIYASTYYRESNEEEMLNHTLKWLCDEGFARLENPDRYVATLQALKLCGSIPNALAG